MTSETGNGSSAGGVDTGRDADLSPSTFSIPLRHFRANRKWKENVERVLGDEFEGKWTSIHEMMDELQTCEPFKDQAGEKWTHEETERVARLICWGLTNEMIGKLIGRTATAIAAHVRKNEEDVDATKGHEEHVLNCQAPGPSEKRQLDVIWCPFGDYSP
ncbi:hypothetical protein NCS52_00316200 [Fusarium sp. LHS14.1]|nr:hypothetical protein NCS52_00316200 [Fusarium sp. LHS14.1]